MMNWFKRFFFDENSLVENAPEINGDYQFKIIKFTTLGGEEKFYIKMIRPTYMLSEHWLDRVMIYDLKPVQVHYWPDDYRKWVRDAEIVIGQEEPKGIIQYRTLEQALAAKTFLEERYKKQKQEEINSRIVSSEEVG